MLEKSLLADENPITRRHEFWRDDESLIEFESRINELLQKIMNAEKVKTGKTRQ